MNTKYKNLLFDADQTLIDFEKDMPLAFQYMYEQSGLAKQKPYSAEILRLYNDCNESWWRRFEQKLCTKAELYRNRFVDFFEVAGLTLVSIDFLQDLYVSGIAKTGTPLPGALDMLRALSERYDLCITTNGNPISQPGRLKNSGVTAFMKGCFISDEIGAAKPDKKYFDYVLAHIPGASTENCLVIGDSLSADIKGAQNAGLDSLWYNPNRKANTLPTPSTFEAASYEDIVRILL